MVSSGEEPNKGFDTGELVWVRRRNGSWWPAQILDPDVLPEGSQRAGTPVKLLGRQDASVDWYNLEISTTKVKAFRCKEYDECIKRVQRLASLPSNKRSVKYTRRDDAVLHALEFENARLGRDRPDLNATQDAASEDDSESGHADSESKQNDSDDDESKGVKRMRGLEDLGMGVASRRRKKRRPLTKVMECATVVPPPTEGVSNESKRNSSVVINNNSDSTSENGTLLSDASLKHKLKDNATFSVPSDPESVSYIKLFGVPVPVPVAVRDYSAAPIIPDASKESSDSSDAEAKYLGNESESTRSGTASGTYGWRFKGKRNSRSRKRYLNNKTQKSVSAADQEGPLARSRKKGGPQNFESGAPPVKSTRVLPPRQSRFTVNPKYDHFEYSLDHRAASGLCDITVEVETSCRPQHVPYISLMSQLTRRAVTGHPVPVKVLKDGSSELDRDLNEDNVFTPENAGKRKARGGRKKHNDKRRSSRRNGILLKKTRKLSLLTGSRRLSHEETKPKPIVEKLKGPAVACVPLTVVFSRLNAALNSSVRAKTSV